MVGRRGGGPEGGERRGGRGNSKNSGQPLFANLYFSVLITDVIILVPIRSALFQRRRMCCRETASLR